MSDSPFIDGNPATVLLPATTTSASFPITGGQGPQARIVNTGANAVRVQFSKDGTMAATTPTSSVPGSPLVLPGTVEIFSRPPGANFLAVKTDTGTSNLEITTGVGD